MGSDDLDFTQAPNPRGTLNPGVIMAGLIIAAGVILFLDQNGIIDASGFWRFWPLALIALGAIKVANCRGSRFPGYVLIAIGLMNAGPMLGVATWARIWPLAIIGVGLLLLLRVLERANAAEPPPANSDSGASPPSVGARLQEWAVFGGGERKISAPDFDGGELFALFGGWDIDLRKAGMKGMQTVIDASAIFGGISLRVPDDWTVTIRGTGIFGGYSDSTRHSGSGNGPLTRHLIVKGVAMFGGVDVKN